MKTLINLVILLAIILCSCKSHERFIAKGIRKGWVDTSTVKTALKVKRDTSSDNSDADKAFNKIASLMCDTCINDSTKKKIKNIIKNELIPDAIKHSYRDTTVTKDGTTISIDFNDDGYNIIVSAKKTEVTTEYRIPWWIWLIIGAMGVLIFLLCIVVLKFHSVYAQN